MRFSSNAQHRRFNMTQEQKFNKNTDKTGCDNKVGFEWDSINKKCI